MKREAGSEVTSVDASAGSVGSAWRISRVDIRSPLSHLSGYIARVELEHVERGRVTDTGSGADILGATFAAVANILRRQASVISVRSCHRPQLEGDERDEAMAVVVIECEGQRHRGAASGPDLLHACLAAFIEALALGEERATER